MIIFWSLTELNMTIIDDVTRDLQSIGLCTACTVSDTFGEDFFAVWTRIHFLILAQHHDKHIISV